MGLLIDWTWLRKECELEDILTTTSKNKKQREKDLEKKLKDIQELWDNYKSCNICKTGMQKKRKQENITMNYD